jgi:ABC-type amino acid transport substrate-binding protein
LKNPVPYTAALAAALALTFASAVHAGPVQDRVASGAGLRVCIWPDYYGVTFRSPRTQQLAGIDIELSEAFAKDLGAKLTYVDSSFPKLIDDLVSDRCDIAMFALGVLPQRQQALRF